MMCRNSNFDAMSSQEREQWLDNFRQWLSVDFPKIETQRVLTPLVKNVMENGLNLLSAFIYCRSFVNDSFMYKDYHRRIKTMRRYADKVTASLQKELNTNVNLADPALLIPHVGRPTKEEMAARALAKQKELEKDKNLFSLAPALGNGENSDALAPNVPMVLNTNKLPSIAELKWLMSPSLQTKADSIRDLRAKAEEASTRAKQMAEDNRAAEDIKPFAQMAADCFEQVNAIYAEVDNEMASVYVRLKEDSTFIAAISKICKLTNIDLRSWLRPYWDKVADKEAFKLKVIERINENDPKQAEARKAAEEKKKCVDAIVKYLQRKDKKNTKVRIESMRKKLDELHSLIGNDADVYEPLLVVAREDYEKNILPAVMAKKSARIAKCNSNPKNS